MGKRVLGKINSKKIFLFSGAIALFWTIAIGIVAIWGIHQESETLGKTAYMWASSLFEKDIVVRRWNAMHGGIYVPITEQTQPNPYLADIEERDIETPAGRKLTLINPAYMTRQIFEIQENEGGVLSHITSLQPIRPENYPDEWEQQALLAFENGIPIKKVVQDIGGQSYYRIIKPLLAEEHCLVCHNQQGYSVGDIQGGISVSVPFSQLKAQANYNAQLLCFRFFILWLVGILGIVVWYQKSKRSILKILEIQKVLQSEAAFVHNNPGLVFRIDKHGIIEKQNPSVDQLMQTNLVGQSIETVLPGLTRNKRLHIIDKNILSFEQKVAGTAYIFSVKFDLKTESFFIYGNEITDLKEAEEALRESEERLSLHIQQTPLAYIEWTPELRVSDWNKSAEKMFGYSKAEVLGKHAFDIIIPDSEKMSIDNVWKGLLDQSGGKYSQNRNCTKAGRIIICEWFNTPLINKSGQVIGLVSMAQDITDRKKMESVLEENLQFMQTLIETIPNPMFYRNTEGVYLGCNQAFADKILGLSKDEIVGSTVFDMPDKIPLELAQKYNQADIDLLRKSGEQVYEAPVKCSDGSTRDYALCEATYNNSCGEVAGIVGVMHDLSEVRQVERALRSSEEKYRSIFSNAQVGLFRSAVSDGKLLECNERFAQIVGYKSIEDCLSDFVLSRNCVNAESFEKTLTMLNKTGEVKNYEAQIIDAQNNLCWLRYSLKLFVEENYIQGVIADITQEKNSFEIIRKSNQKVISILASISDGFYTLDNRMNVTYINCAAEKILNCRGANIINRNFLNTFPSFKDTIIPQEFQLVLERGQPRAFEVNLSTEQRSEWHGIKVYPNEDGISVYFQEISQRKNFEQKLIDKEFRLRSIFDATVDGFIVIDREGLIDSMNPAACKLFGCPDEIDMTYNIKTFIPEFINSCFNSDQNLLAATIANKMPFEFTGLKSDGHEFPLKVSVSELKLHQQQFYTLVVHDLTEERNKMRQLIEVDKFSSIGTLAAGVAHEFKNYLAGIIGNASFALDNLDCDGIECARETLQQIITIGESANNTAMSLLTYSRKNPQMKSKEDINTLISNIAALVEKDAQVCGIEIEMKLGDLPQVYVIPASIQQMVLNLLLNAIQAVDKNGRIEITSSCYQDKILVTIIDDGCGIPPEIIGKIFDPFFSTKGVWGKSARSGTGLGLSICRNILTEHAGKIEVESKLGQGSTFTVQFNAVTDEVADQGLLKKLCENKCVLFSVDEKLIEKFNFECCDSSLNSSICQTLEGLQDVSPGSQIVILDARFPGLGELYRAADFCKSQGTDFILVNTGDTSELQMLGLIDDAVCVFAGWPEIFKKSRENKIIETV